MNDNKNLFLNNKLVNFTDIKTGKTVTVERAGQNRFYISHGDDGVKIVPFVPAYQVVSEQSIACIKDRRFITEYIPARV